MTNKKHRKLAAILFADIVGYTALMQKDEALARNLLQKFRNTLNESVPQHRGEIINNYGDGCLCTFESAVDAMTCAKAVQVIFQEDPIVPVRIGLHSGDVFFEDDNVFGDSVNIASRIESLGVAGAVLFSKRIKRDIANQTEFEVQSLGEFDFKNVEKTMEVFGLANEGLVIPKQTELQGKLKAPNKTSSPLLKAIGALLTIMLISGGIWWFSQAQQAQLSDEIRLARTAVLPFENLTNNKDFDVVGRMAADWITEGLMSQEDIKIVSYNNVKENLALASMDLTQQSNAKFMSATGAEKLITGRIYLEGNQLILKSSLQDAATGTIENVFKSIAGNPEQPSKVLEELIAYILGYYAAKDNVKYGKTVWGDSPPKVEAYAAFDKGMDFFGKDYDKAIYHFQQAQKIDSTFYSPYLWHITAYSNIGQPAIADSLYAKVQQRFQSLSPRNQLLSEFMPALIMRNNQKAYETIKKMLKVDPKDPTVNYLAGSEAYILNRPKETVDIYSILDAEIIDYNKPSYAWWNSVYASALTRTKQYEKALAIIDYVPKDFGSIAFPLQKARIYVLTNQIDSLQNLLHTIENQTFFNGNVANVFSEIGHTFGLMGDKIQQKSWNEKAIQWINNQPEGQSINHYDLAESNYNASNYQTALPMFESLLHKTDKQKAFGSYIFYKRRIALLHAKLNDTAAAETILSELKAIDYKYDFGYTAYAIGSIYAQFGEKQKAINWLKQAFQKGYSFSAYRYDNDLDLQTLKGEAAWDDFVQPIMESFELPTTK